MNSTGSNGPQRHSQQQQQQYQSDVRPGSSSGSGSGGAALPPLSLSILGVEPLDEFIKEVADFVHHMITTRPEHLGGVVEVEAKLGLLKDTRTGQRLGLPVLVESNNFYTDSPGDSREKIRVTRDEKTSTVVQCVKKIRLGDLNIYSPKRAADWRVSVSLEVPASHPLGSPSYSRRKDRMRYTHEEFMIDLTQVTTQPNPSAPAQQSHELELEIARPELLLATAMKRNDVSVSEHERSAFDELIRAFVNNARILVRNSDAWQG
ncbi:hypothetical protein EST38_g524 [Candolleomyces aberdarensis]|uniref:mRNA-capping enzyme subunit beta n=1 Tax=Candolleomyces aberdarensis TaxID=2316362 RepID=A0A4Q2DZE7_9AGAR|nr:hypothetical protein EST38_g524 [Candolleomyces aberdarensis]